MWKFIKRLSIITHMFYMCSHTRLNPFSLFTGRPDILYMENPFMDENFRMKKFCKFSPFLCRRVNSIKMDTWKSWKLLRNFKHLIKDLNFIYHSNLLFYSPFEQYLNCWRKSIALHTIEREKLFATFIPCCFSATFIPFVHASV